MWIWMLFFAAVETQRHPEYAGKPVVIGGRGDPSVRGVVSTASYEARQFGIHSAMPLRTAYQLCPQAVFLPVDYGAYSRVSVRVKAILRQVSSLMEDVGIDEAYLDVSHLDEPAEAVARRIKEAIRAGTGLTCSVGVAPNKLLAKIASDLQKPDGLTTIGEADLAVRIWPLPARKIPGVGPVTETRLRGLGVATIGDLAARSLQELVALFGRSHGLFLHRAAHGLDDRPVVTRWEPKSRSRETTFLRDTDNWQAIARTLAALSRGVAEELRNEGYRARTVGIKVRFEDFETRTREKTLTRATDAPDTIRKTAFECLGRLELKKKVRLLGVRAGELEKTEDSLEDGRHDLEIQDKGRLEGF